MVSQGEECRKGGFLGGQRGFNLEPRRDKRGAKVSTRGARINCLNNGATRGRQCVQKQRGSKKKDVQDQRKGLKKNWKFWRDFPRNGWFGSWVRVVAYSSRYWVLVTLLILSGIYHLISAITDVPILRVQSDLSRRPNDNRSASVQIFTGVFFFGGEEPPGTNGEYHSNYQCLNEVRVYNRR